MKERIASLTLVSVQARLEPEAWFTLRIKAAVDVPSARAHHVSAVLGAGLFVHGGQSSQGNKTLSDWHLFDFGLQVWINCMVLDVTSLEMFDHSRKYHTMTAVVEPTLTNGRELTRLVWVSPLHELMRKPTATELGMYMFGGIDEQGKQTDDLVFVWPDFKTNSKNISNKLGDYKTLGSAEVSFLAEKLNPEGRGPIARSQHAATFFKNQLVIFGGRNDEVFPTIKNVALNDLHIYDVAKNRWATIAIYGDMPESRWGHRLVANENKIMLFGGMNLSSYCESVIFDIHLGKYTNCS